jgi:hypothetical protein
VNKKGNSKIKEE